MVHLRTKEQSVSTLGLNYRQLVHLSSILVPVLVEVTSKPFVLAALCAVTLGYAVLELLRIRGRLVPLISKFTLRMSREDERSHFIAAPIFLAVGVILVLLLFPRNIAYASIVVVAIGDPVAAYVGGEHGRRRVGSKSLEGFAAGALIAFLPTLILVPPIVGAIGSVTGLLLELIGGVDDNLTIPVGSGAAMFLASVFMGL
jgi:dolichol kinase